MMMMKPSAFQPASASYPFGQLGSGRWRRWLDSGPIMDKEAFANSLLGRALLLILAEHADREGGGVSCGIGERGGDERITHHDRGRDFEGEGPGSGRLGRHHNPAQEDL